MREKVVAVAMKVEEGGYLNSTLVFISFQVIDVDPPFATVTFGTI